MTRLFHEPEIAGVLKKNCTLRNLSSAARCGMICHNCLSCVCGRCFNEMKPRYEYETYNGINYPTGEIKVPDGV